MPLERYREKRRFPQTPEPAGSDAAASAEPLAYCVHRHHARQLHYDLRLQVGDSLKSWAVPKGPTLDPAEKRLAMMVEDHPIEYGGFEGVIPKGNYGAGSVMLWDRGTYEPLGNASPEEQLARGDFRFRLQGEKVQGEFALVRMKRGRGNEWLLLKKRDAAARPGWNTEDHAYSVLSGLTQEEIAQGFGGILDKPAPAPVPENIAPMLAELGKGEPPATPGWIYEVKWDGVRAMCYVEGGRVRLLSRTGNRMDQQYPELSALPHHVNARSAILDGEIVSLDERGAPSFERLQHRMHLTDAGAVAALTRKDPVVLYVFDLLYADGRDLRGLPVEERKRLLRELLSPSATIRFSEHFENGLDLLAAVRAQGIEGIIAKRLGSAYQSRRSADWVKYKVQSSDSFVLCGFTKGEREVFGALVLGLFEGDKLTWAGDVGTGFDRKMMQTIYAKLAPLATEKCPLEPDKNLPKKDVTWTRPELVCEVRFANWTADGRLRAPVFLGLRPDVDPRECVRPGSASDPPAARAPLLDPAKSEQSLTIGGRRLKFTNLDKIFYPDQGYRKRDLLNYYDAVAPLLVPHLKDRPLSLKRYPNGITGKFFFQKEVSSSFPKWLPTDMADGIRHVIGADRATLLFLVNLGCIDHNPWMSRVGSLENPDYLLIDLDPNECGYDKIVDAALLVRGLLDRAELESYPKTTGGDGMHIIVPLEPRYTYEQVRGFAELLAAMAVRARPNLFTTPRAVSKREKGRVYFDWARIARGQTISAPYVLRAYPGAPVATPLAWREVTPRLDPKQFHIGNALSRFDRLGDLFAGVLRHSQTLEAALKRLGA